MPSSSAPPAKRRGNLSASLLWLCLPFLLWLGLLPFGDWALVTLGWYLVSFLFGFVALPLARRLLPRQPGAHFLLARPLGLVFTGLALWTPVTLGLFPYSRASLLTTLVLLALLLRLPGLGRRQFRPPAPPLTALLGEVLFLAAFLAFAWLRGMQPELDGLEKFMDLAFLSSTLRGSVLPALDPWYAGSRINYYAFGQYLWSLPARLLDTSATVAYNLAFAGVFACFTSLAAVLGSALVALGRRSQASRLAGGLLAALLATFGGNGHAFFYAPGSPGRLLTRAAACIGIQTGELEPYAFSDATRFIGYNPPTDDRTIHEFPWYSFLVGDLHAHIINTATVLLGLIILVELARCLHTPEPDRRRAARLTLVLGLTGAVSALANFWDYIIYAAVFGLVLMALMLLGLRQGSVPQTGEKISFAVLALTIALLVALELAGGPDLVPPAAVVLALTLAVLVRRRPDPAVFSAFLLALWFAAARLGSWTFSRQFVPMSDTIRAVTNRTAPWQFLVLWGTLLLLAALLSLFARRTDRGSGAALLLALFTAAALCLLIIPELVYVVDIYGAGYARANTMFKFTYQAFILLTIVIGAGLALVLPSLPQRPASLPLTLVIILLATQLAIYPLGSSGLWLRRPSLADWRGLDGGAWLREEKDHVTDSDGRRHVYRLAEDAAVIDWLNTNEHAQVTILEAAGPSYTHFARISAYTGLPTVIGWETHEWLWRTSREVPHAWQRLVEPRQALVRSIYETADPTEAAIDLARYDIRYIVIGELERIRYPGLNENGLAALGETVLLEGNTRLIRLPEAAGP